MSVNFAPQYVPNNYPEDMRAVVDGNYVQNVALPVATGSAVNTFTNAMDLLVVTPYSATENFNVQLIIGPVVAGNSTNSLNCNASIQQTTANSDGTPNSTAWANIPEFAVPLIQTTDNGNGNVGANFILKLSPSDFRFIRGAFKAEANSGNWSSGNGTLQLLF